MECWPMHLICHHPYRKTTKGNDAQEFGTATFPGLVSLGKGNQPQLEDALEVTLQIRICSLWLRQTTRCFLPKFTRSLPSIVASIEGPKAERNEHLTQLPFSGSMCRAMVKPPWQWSCCPLRRDPCDGENSPRI